MGRRATDGGEVDLAEGPGQSALPAEAGALVERRKELADLERSLGSVLVGDGRCVFVQGPSGVGKTSLLRVLVEMASARGMSVLRARGAEREQEFPYGVVRQLLEGNLRTLEPSQRESVFSGAAAHAAAIFDIASAEVPPPLLDASFAAIHGLYWLVADLAAQRPLALLVDDLHWSDAPSARWVDYLSRRLEGVPILVALAARRSEPDAAPLVDQLADEAHVATIQLSGLTPSGAMELIRSRAPAADNAFCEACFQVTAGNPFLLNELVKAARSEDLPLTGDGAAALGSLGPATIAARVAQQLHRHGEPAERVARAISVLGADASLAAVSELAGIESTETARAIDRLIASGLLARGAQFDFAHPVVRSAVYEGIPPAERLRTHEAAAKLLVHGNAAAERIASHFLHCEARGNPQAVDLLREAALHARSRGAPDLAVRYLHRALEETGEADHATVQDLGVALLANRELEAFVQLRRAIDLAPDHAVRDQASLALVRALGVAGRPREALEFAREALARGVEDPALAVRIESELVAMAWLVPDAVSEAVKRLEHLERQAPKAEMWPFAAVHRALQLTRDAAPLDQALATARVGLEGGLLLESNSSLPFIVLITLVWNDELDQPRALCDAAMAFARQTGSRHLSVNAGAFGGLATLRAGRLAETVSSAQAAYEFARESAMPGSIDWAWALAILIDALRERGEIEDAEELLVEAGADGELSGEFTFVMLLESRGRLRYAQGRLEQATADLLEAGRRWEPFGLANPSISSWRCDAAVALDRQRERDQALSLVEHDLDAARRVGAPRALGISLRVAGMIERDEGLLGEAVEVLADSPARLECAKALYELGAHHRRAARKQAAREPLLSALDLARRCTATALADRVMLELEAIGSRPRRPYVQGVEALTPGELRIAEMAAAGNSNKEIAQALYLTLRTVETHLTHVYRKLDITSRANLPAALEPQQVA